MINKKTECLNKLSTERNNFNKKFKTNKIQFHEIKSLLSLDTLIEINKYYNINGNKLLSSLITDFMSWGNIKAPYMIYRDINRNF